MEQSADLRAEIEQLNMDITHKNNKDQNKIQTLSRYEIVFFIQVATSEIFLPKVDLCNWILRNYISYRRMESNNFLNSVS